MTNFDRAKLANQIAQDTCSKTAVETSLAIATAAQQQTPALTDQEFNALTKTVWQFRNIFTNAIAQDKRLADLAARRAPKTTEETGTAPTA